MTWTLGGRTNIRKELGRNWVFGQFLATEDGWLRTVYKEFNPCNPPRRVKADPAWLTWNHGTVRALAQGMHRQRRFEEMPILADALEDAGCSNAEILRHCRKQGPHQKDCWVLGALLGRLA
jgi:hypothetical protein